MASTDASPSPPPLAPRKENLTPIGSRIAELSESRAELLNRLQSLKQDLQSWRAKADAQVKAHRNELAELKKSLNVEVEQLRSEFQELRNTLQQQQEDVTAGLKCLGLRDGSSDSKVETAQDQIVEAQEQDAFPEHSDKNAED